MKDVVLAPTMVRVTKANDDTNWYKVGEEYNVLPIPKYSSFGNYYPLVGDESIGIGVDDCKALSVTPISPGPVVKKQGTLTAPNKYSREIKPGVFVDVYDVIRAFAVTDPCLQHLLKKALAAGVRGHKDTKEDLLDIQASANRAVEIYNEWNGDVEGGR